MAARARRDNGKQKTPAQRQLMYAGWLIALVAVIGIVLRPVVPWLYLWAPMLTFGAAKLPSELRDLWRAWRARRGSGA